MRKYFLAGLLFCSSLCTTLIAQNYAVSQIDDELLYNANAVIREEITEIELKAIDKMILRTRRVVTVLNEHGDAHTRPGERYDEEWKIKKQQAFIYDKKGKQVRKVKKRDFKDRSLVSSNDLFSDNRLSFFDFTPYEYPYTLVYESEVRTSSTVFVKPWQPIPSYLVSVESSEYKLINSAGIPLRFDERNFPEKIQQNNVGLDLHYKVKDLPAYRSERLSPVLSSFAPELLVALNEFSLVGVKGRATNWREFGKWQYDNLLTEKTGLPEATVGKINALTVGAASDLEKARLIYEYVQENTRYISIQLGIGGWEPMTATEVDQLGYGDCKALTNYTKALLESQGIASNYAVVYGGAYDNIDPDFASKQGDHVILNLPLNEEDIWLECTSQTAPFNYLGDFTDNRNVLLVKPDGGEIVRTKKYKQAENLQESISLIRLQPNGNFSAETTRSSRGVPYGKVYSLERKKTKNQKLHYKESWGHLQNLQLQNISFINNRKATVFTEELEFTGEKLASKAGNRLLLPVNFFFPETVNLPRNETRRFPLEIMRGRSYKDYFEFYLPPNYTVEALPEGLEIANDFGNFSLVISSTSHEEQQLIKVERIYSLNEGLWPAEDYEAFREFMNQIKALNNRKAVLVANN